MIQHNWRISFNWPYIVDILFYSVAFCSGPITKIVTYFTQIFGLWNNYSISYKQYKFRLWPGNRCKVKLSYFPIVFFSYKYKQALQITFWQISRDSFYKYLSPDQLTPLAFFSSMCPTCYFFSADMGKGTLDSCML